jgi:2-polyprenyl-3-methyl-5-hydroxy-6-metoxy-1,4-benzoquinol methylase
MEDSVFQKYSMEHVHFYDEEVSPILEYGLALILKSCQKPRVADLGCGDGRILFALHKKGVLKDVGEIVGIDISERRIGRLKSNLPFVRGIVSDALNIKELLSHSFDFVICSQLIEHVEDDDALVLEIRRLLRNGGMAYLSSVVKKRYGVYFYFKDGSFKLDPTHVREYSSTNEFVGVVASKGFEVIRVKTRQAMFPLLDLIIRLLVKFGHIKPNSNFFQRHKVLGKVRQLKAPIVGYKIIEVLARKVE